MGLQFICSQIQLLSSRLHQIGPNLRWECCNDIMPALAAAIAGSVCVCVCVFWMKREGDGEGERQMTLSA